MDPPTAIICDKEAGSAKAANEISDGRPYLKVTVLHLLLQHDVCRQYISAQSIMRPSS